MDQRCVLEVALTALGDGTANSRNECKGCQVMNNTMIDTCTGKYWTTEEVHPTQSDLEHREAQKKLAGAET